MAKESQPTQQFVEIEDIKNGVVVMKDGSLRSVLMVSGINLELKSEEEQNIAVFSYQNFLNSLDFSVQLVIHSRKLNIKSYLDKLEEYKNREENELLKNQISEYSEFIRSYVETNAVMAKTFFAAVPYASTIISGGSGNFLDIFKFGGKGKTSAAKEKEGLEQKIVQLNQRVDQVVSGLKQIGLRVVALNDEELIELFYNLYNPGSVEKKDIKLANG
jgi:type IV secretory pathway VirB4 component